MDDRLILEFLAVDRVSAIAERMGRNVEGIAGRISKAFGPLGSVLAAPFEMLSKGLSMLGSIGGLVGGGLVAFIDHLASSTAEYSAKILRNSVMLGQNTGLLQTLTQAAKLLGVEQDALNLMLFRFERNLFQSGVQLQTMGINLRDLGVTTRDPSQALLQLADYFQKTSDSAQKAAIAQGLFGRSGKDMIALLNMGSSGLKSLNEEFNGFGLILTDAQLKVGALANAVHSELKLALEGIGMQVGTRLQIGFMVLWATIAKVAGGGAALFNKLGEVISRIVTFLAGFVGGLFGVKVRMDDITATLGKNSAALELQSGAAQGAAAAIDDTGQKAAKATTAFTAETRAIDDQKRAYDELLDSQISSLRAQLQQIDYDYQQSKLEEQLAHDRLAIAADQAAQGAFPLSISGFSLVGSDMSALNDKTKADQQKLADDLGQLAHEQQKHELDGQISKLEAEKKAQDDAFADQLERIRRVKEDATASDQAMLNSSLGTTAGMTNGWNMSTGEMKGLIDSFTGHFGSDMDGILSKGQDTANKVKGFFGDLFTFLTAYDDSTMRSAWDRMGRDLGEAFVDGMTGAMVDKLTKNGGKLNWFGQFGTWLGGLPNAVSDLTTAPAYTGPVLGTGAGNYGPQTQGGNDLGTGAGGASVPSHDLGDRPDNPLLKSINAHLEAIRYDSGVAGGFAASMVAG